MKRQRRNLFSSNKAYIRHLEQYIEKVTRPQEFHASANGTNFKITFVGDPHTMLIEEEPPSWSYCEYKGKMYRSHPEHKPQIQINGEWEDMGKNLWIDEYEKFSKNAPDIKPSKGISLMSKAMSGTFMSLGKLGKINRKIMKLITKETKE